MKNIINTLLDLWDDFYVIIIIITLIVTIVVLWNITAYRDVDELKGAAPQFIIERGYTITSYDGYEGDPFVGGGVWYQARDVNGYLYQMKIIEWRGEYQIYDLECLNAVSNEK